MKKIIASVITAFNEDNSINIELFQEIVNALDKHYLDGIVIASFTGEGPLLTTKEKIQLLQSCQNIKSKIYIQLFAAATSQLLNEIKRLDQFPFSGYFITLPHLIQPKQDGIIKHFDLASQQTQKEIYIYNAPARVGTSINFNSIIQLSKRDNIIGIINEAHDLDLITSIKKCAPSFEYLISDERILDVSFNHGADGIVSNLIQIIPDDIVELVNNYDEDISNQKLLEFSNLIADLISLDQKAITLKYILNYNKELRAIWRLPMTPLTKDKKHKIDLIID